MDGYRYWVERHKLLIELAAAKDDLDGRPDKERLAGALVLESQFRARLDAIYGQVRDEFEASPEKN